MNLVFFSRADNLRCWDFILPVIRRVTEAKVDNNLDLCCSFVNSSSDMNLKREYTQSFLKGELNSAGEVCTQV